MAKSYPQGVRFLIYSFMDLDFLLHKGRLLSKKESHNICESHALDQQRVLKIGIQDGVRIKYDAYFRQALAIASGYQICLYRFKDSDIFLVSTLLELIREKYNRKSLAFWI